MTIIKDGFTRRRMKNHRISQENSLKKNRYLKKSRLFFPFSLIISTNYLLIYPILVFSRQHTSIQHSLVEMRQTVGNYHIILIRIFQIGQSLKSTTTTASCEHLTLLLATRAVRRRAGRFAGLLCLPPVCQSVRGEHRTRHRSRQRILKPI